MSHDTKTIGKYSDCSEHSDTSAVSLVSSFLIDIKRKDLDSMNNEQRLMQLPTNSVSTMYGSETDEGAYETPSEDIILSKRSSIEIYREPKESLCSYFTEESTSFRKLSTFDGNQVSMKREVIIDPQNESSENRLTEKIMCIPRIMSESLTKSKSMPILRSEMRSSVPANFKARKFALTSESSFARKKKMSMIVKRMVPLIFPYLSTASTMTISRINSRDIEYKEREFKSRTLSPTSNDTTAMMINTDRSGEFTTEVILDGMRNNRFITPQNDNSIQHAIRASLITDEGATKLTEDSDIIYRTGNSYSSIKSIYFPPNSPDTVLPCDSTNKSKKRQGMSMETKALRKIDYELSPLRYQLSKIIGEARALGVNSTRSFGLDVTHSHLRQPDYLDRNNTLSSNSTLDYASLVHHVTSRHTTIAARSQDVETQHGFVGKTTTSTTFSVVGKSTSRRSRTSWFNENGTSGRQEALNLTASRDSFYQICARSDYSYRNEKDRPIYLSTNNRRAVQGQDFNTLNESISNRNARYNDYNANEMETEIPKWRNCTSNKRISSNSTNVLRRNTGHSCLRQSDQTTDISRVYNWRNLVRKRESSVFKDFFDGSYRSDPFHTMTCHSNCTSKSTIVETIGNNQRINNEEVKRLNEHLTDDTESTAMQTTEKKCISHRKNHSCTSTNEIKRVINGSNDDDITMSSELKLSDHSVNGNQRQITRGTTTRIESSCASSRLHIVNTEFRSAVEKRYTNRAVSPIQNSCSRDTDGTALSMTSPSNILLTTVSSIFVQQVQAAMSAESSKGESSTEKTPAIDNNEATIVDTVKNEDPYVQEIFRSNTMDTLKHTESNEDKVDLTVVKSANTRYRHLPERTREITIVPIVFLDNATPETRQSVDIDFAVRKNPDGIILNYHRVPSQKISKKSLQPSSTQFHEMSGKNVSDSYATTAIEESSNGDYSKKRTNEVFVSRIGDTPDRPDLHMRESDYERHVHLTRSNMRVGDRRMRKCHDSVKSRTVTKTIPGIRSSPEDFLCDT